MESAQARPSLHLSKCHIVGNHMSWLNYDHAFSHFDTSICSGTRYVNFDLCLNLPPYFACAIGEGSGNTADVQAGLSKHA